MEFQVCSRRRESSSEILSMVVIRSMACISTRKQRFSTLSTWRAMRCKPAARPRFGLETARPWRGFSSRSAVAHTMITARGAGRAKSHVLALTLPSTHLLGLWAYWCCVTRDIRNQASTRHLSAAAHSTAPGFHAVGVLGSSLSMTMSMTAASAACSKCTTFAGPIGYENLRRCWAGKESEPMDKTP
jgi:hypothetical protein